MSAQRKQKSQQNRGKQPNHPPEADKSPDHILEQHDSGCCNRLIT